ncbi:hypothetical protein P3L10_014190 [Capsicum annuum]
MLQQTNALSPNLVNTVSYMVGGVDATAHTEQTAVAVVDDDRRLIEEISGSKLAYCDENVAAEITTLSSGDLMAYIDCGGPPEDLIGLVRTTLQEKKLGLMMELMDEESPASSSSSSASSSSSSDESRLSRNRSSGRSSTRRSEAITCYPGSSLVSVLIQALAHRASSIWVIDEDDHDLVRVVTFKGILKAFRSIANATRKPERRIHQLNNKTSFYTSKQGHCNDLCKWSSPDLCKNNQAVTKMLPNHGDSDEYFTLGSTIVIWSNIATSSLYVLLSSVNGELSSIVYISIANAATRISQCQSISTFQLPMLLECPHVLCEVAVKE